MFSGHVLSLLEAYSLTMHFFTDVYGKLEQSVHSHGCKYMSVATYYGCVLMIIMVDLQPEALSHVNKPFSVRANKDTH